MNTRRTPEVIFEFRPIGSIVRVSAVDVATGTEVTIQGPASAGKHQLQQVALQKLRYVMAKKDKN